MVSVVLSLTAAPVSRRSVGCRNAWWRSCLSRERAGRSGIDLAGADFFDSFEASLKQQKALWGLFETVAAVDRPETLQERG